jgi:hypothetical protein
MALHFLTSAPKKLIDAFKSAIDAGHVKTWAYDSAGDFTHTASQWNKEAWLRPTAGSDRLTFNILPPKNKTITWEIYGVYHGRFIEAMIIHCNQLFTQGISTSNPASGDSVQG